MALLRSMLQIKHLFPADTLGSMCATFRNPFQVPSAPAVPDKASKRVESH